MTMPLALSKLTAQGQILVPVEVRRKLGLRPGSVLEWYESGGDVIVRRASRYTSVQVCEVLFGTLRPAKSKTEVKEGIRKDIRRRRRHAGD
jgi:AbrB family looped-hinge helix DNA binding protein